MREEAAPQPVRVLPQAGGLIRWLIPGLALGGVGISAYLAYLHYQGVPPYCAGLGGCEVVAASPYSQAAGVPVALMGLGSYLLLLGLGSWWLRARAGWALLGLFGLSLSGTLYSGYLSYVELFLLGAVCLWCLASAAIVLGIFTLSLIEMSRA